MPFKSAKRRRFLFAQKPQVAKQFTRHTQKRPTKQRRKR